MSRRKSFRKAAIRSGAANHKCVRRLLLLALLCCTASSAFAQTQKAVRLKLEALSIRGRSSSSIPLQIKLEYNENQMLEGDLVLEVYNSVPTAVDLMATIRYEGIVLQGTDYIFNTVLPPFEHSHNQQYMIVGWFDTPNGRLSLSRDPEDPEEPHELLSIGQFERATLVCSVSGRRDFLKPSSTRAFLNNALSLEPYNPEIRSATNPNQRLNARQVSDVRRVQNFACSWNAYELPEDPLHLCAFDVVLLADNSLSRLEEGQMAALQTWVAAGGSLCVLPDDNRLQKPHLQFLQTLFERPSHPDLHLTINDDGTLLVISDDDSPIVNGRFGLGRVSLLPNSEDLPERLTGPELGNLVGHLFKVRSNSSVFQGEKWSQTELDQLLKARGLMIKEDQDGFRVVDGSGRPMILRGYYRNSSREELAAQMGLNYELQPKSSPLVSAAVTALMPKDVKMVPSYIIGMLLFAYVITIGPVDYFVLGFFKARKYTWLLFPVVTALFTVLTVSIAHSYMASTDTGGRITVVDLVDDGQPARQTDLQLHFYASQTTLTEDATNAFFVPAQMVASDNNMMINRPMPQTVNKKVDYSGRFPQSYGVQQRMRQWEPQLNRTLTLAPDIADVPKLPWDDPALVATQEGREKLRVLLNSLAANGQRVKAVAVNLTNGFAISPSGVFDLKNVQNALQRTLNNQGVYDYTPAPRGGRDEVAMNGMVAASSRTATQDFFSIVSQVSPQGSGTMEDMAIHDPTDPNEWLLILAVEEGDNITFYRRLFHIESK